MAKFFGCLLASLSVKSGTFLTGNKIRDCFNLKKKSHCDIVKIDEQIFGKLYTLNRITLIVCIVSMHLLNMGQFEQSLLNFSL